jgi:multidrug/hemolysin transport system ATP-binding protein
MSNIIEVKDLIKNYGEHTAVDQVSFNVKSGHLFAFLGPNGAGKSTTINAICTTLKKTSGQIIVNGYEIGREDEKIRDSIGVVFQESLLDSFLTVRENLRVRASFYNLTKDEFESKLNEIKSDVGIDDFLDQRYSTLSGGQKRRADIARALINEPQILFLDEPTTGLDPQTRMKVWEIIKKLQKEKHMTVFLTTHYMEEANEADDVVIIDNGKVVAQGTPNELRLQYSSDVLKVNAKNSNDFISKINREFSVIGDIIKIPVRNSLEALDILKDVEKDINSFEVIRGNMDDVFVNITGREIR